VYAGALRLDRQGSIVGRVRASKSYRNLELLDRNELPLDRSRHLPIPAESSSKRLDCTAAFR
jgi:hypothetical protein